MVNPSLLAVDDSQIVYVCGHNTVIYNTETPGYRFIQGKSEDECGAKVTICHLFLLQFWWLIQLILVVWAGVEGTQGITAMAISHNKKYLAICERAPQAVCFIYETHSLKRRRMLTSSESVAKEFIDVKFAYSEEKLTNFLFTLVSIFTTHSFIYHHACH